MGPRHTPPEHSWLFFATCFQIVQFRGLVAFHDLFPPRSPDLSIWPCHDVRHRRKRFAMESLKNQLR
ncbi:unnamed protein product, partial [Callosobruchus maculatus]